MSGLPASIPRACELDGLRQDPFEFLARCRIAYGDRFVLSEASAVFSRAPDCAGAIAVFGPRNHRAVLGDIEAFGMPQSVGQRFGFPRHLVKLNFGLFSMRGEQHRKNQRLLARLLNRRSRAAHYAAAAAGLDAFSRDWRVNDVHELLTEMRRLALDVSARLLFGGDTDESRELGAMIQSYFERRREYASPSGVADDVVRAELVALGTQLSRALRRRVRACAKEPAASGGLLHKLVKLELEPGCRLGEDDLIGHANVLFMSSSEPVAVALTWTFLILSQLPDLRRALRLELERESSHAAVPRDSEVARLTLLDAVVRETLRLLPPNALMVRLTTQPTQLFDLALPARCELLLCPFLAHREAARFPRPDEFLPERWSSVRPSPFEYLPFGSGGRYCMGREVATYTIKAALGFLLRRYDVVLAHDQAIDWRMHINLTPRTQPVVALLSPRESNSKKSGKLGGPVANLIRLRV